MEYKYTVNGGKKRTLIFTKPEDSIEGIDKEHINYLKKLLGKDPSFEIAYKVWNRWVSITYFTTKKKWYKYTFKIFILLGTISLVLPFICNMNLKIYTILIGLYSTLFLILGIHRDNFYKKYSIIKELYKNIDVIHIRKLIDSTDGALNGNFKIISFLISISPIITSLLVFIIKQKADKVFAVILLTIIIFFISCIVEYFYEKNNLKKLKNFLTLLEYEMINGYEYNEENKSFKEKIKEIFKALIN